MLTFNIQTLGGKIVDQGQSLAAELQDILDSFQTRAIERISAVLEDQRETIALLGAMVNENMDILMERERELRRNGEIEEARTVAARMQFHYDETLFQIEALEEKHAELAAKLRKAQRETAANINSVIRAFQGEKVKTGDAKLDALIAKDAELEEIIFGDPELARLIAEKPLVANVIRLLASGKFSFEELGRVFNFNFGLEKPIPHVIESLALWLSRIPGFGEVLAQVLRETSDEVGVRMMKAGIAMGIEDKLKEIAKKDPDPERKQKPQEALDAFKKGLEQKEPTQPNPDRELTVEHKMDPDGAEVKAELSEILGNKEVRSFNDFAVLLDEIDPQYVDLFVSEEVEAWFRDTMGFPTIADAIALLRNPIDGGILEGSALRTNIKRTIISILEGLKEHAGEEHVKDRARRALVHFKHRTSSQKPTS
jgi:hypothetical protein